LIVGISVKQKHRPTVENRATKKSAQAAYTFLTRLMRGARNIEGKAEAAKNILRFCSGERTRLACWRKRPAFANFEIQKVRFGASPKPGRRGDRSPDESACDILTHHEREPPCSSCTQLIFPQKRDAAG
jgi:hypothetical protein